MAPIPRSGPVGTPRESGAIGPWRSRGVPARKRVLAWLPAGCLLTLTAVVLGRYGVTVGQSAVFAGYLVFGVALPGLLVVRALYGRLDRKSVV